MPIYEDEATEENFGAEWTWGTDRDEWDAEVKRTLHYVRDVQAQIWRKVRAFQERHNDDAT